MRHINSEKLGAALRNCTLQIKTVSLMLLLLLSLGLLSAQIVEDYQLLKSYTLPDTAVAASETVEQAGMRLYRGLPFSGITYELYANQRLSRIITWKNGVQDGPSYVWYPGGEPQMSVNYRRGKIHGRFLGWYMHGGILYDMVINDKGYAGDNISDDGSREAGGDVEDEREGSDND